MPKSTPLLRSLRKQTGEATQVVAEAVGFMNSGSLRNVENGTQPADEHRFHRLAAYYTAKLGKPVSVEALMAKDEPKDKKRESGGSGSGPADNRPTTKPAKKSAA